MRLLSEQDVIALSRPNMAIAAAESAYKALTSGQAQIPLRTEILGEVSDGVILVMPGFVRQQAFGLKIIATKPDVSEAAGMKDREDNEVAHVTNGTHRQSYVQDCPPRANCVTLLIRHPQGVLGAKSSRRLCALRHA